MNQRNAYAVVREFEEMVADYAGSKFAVAVDTCTAAILLCCQYCKVVEVTVPKRTYISVPFSVIHAGGRVRFEDLDWQGIYQLKPYPILDSALRFTKGMYQQGYLQCLSFHWKKRLSIGRGGMILTDDKAAVRWLKQMRYDGREEMPLEQDNVSMVGWCFYMEPERAARGLTLMNALPEHNPDIPGDYPDISTFPVFQRETLIQGDQGTMPKQLPQKIARGLRMQ